MSLLIFFLTLSVILNGLFIWYIRKMLEKLLFVSDNIGDLLNDVNQFAGHLDSVHSMELFYGDQTLQSLLQHSKQVKENIKEFEQVYTLTSESVIGEDEEDVINADAQ
jgi:hypothetical protein